ncbi:MAG TPA: aminotransferase class V-fold PLP-dependent enzyme [Flavipsychrobacter sp.]|nr:aminotransferase class V-fold PLP-dependent enzyme [Flavipsychrobacter sp.]
MLSKELEAVLGAAYADFISSHNAYLDTAHIDALRATEFSRLDEQGHTYIDFTGGGLYAKKQIIEHSQKLINGVFGNPHSSNPTSVKATEVTEAARKCVLSYFNASPDEYICVFTQNASGALKLLGEAYPFEKDDHYLLTFDNHNSVNGIREFARNKGAIFNYTPIRKEDLRLDAEKLMENLDQHISGANKLFAFPAQSNVSGVKHDLEWINIAQQKGWDVLLDAAAFVPSNKLDLSIYKPEFVAISFYKIFGYPTGLGCLLIRNTAFAKLRRPWFAGGTVSIVSVQGDGFSYDNGQAMFEDGTINYLDIPAIEIGLKHIESIGIESIGKRIECLTDWALQQLQSLHHDNGDRLVKIYGPQDTTDRGGTIAMNFYDEDGDMYDFLEIEQMANARNISLRTGCFCNPGIDETYHAFEEKELKDYFDKSGSKNYRDLIDFVGKRRGAVRISFGYISNFKDAYTYLLFAESLLNKKRAEELEHLPAAACAK